MFFGRMVGKLIGQSRKKDIILNQTRRENNIIYGARAMNKQLSIGLLKRPTQDFDIYSKAPKRSAIKLERKLDRVSGDDNYFVKPSKHKGTWKVKDKGYDNIPNTNDDIKIADYTPMPKPQPRTVLINDVRFVHLSEVLKDKKRTLRNPKYAFRHGKDEADVQRIKASQMLRGII
jgi:hypothetical protein